MSDTLEVPDLTKDLSSAEGQTETSPRKEEKPVKEELTVPDLKQDLSKADSVKPQAQDLKVPDLKQDLKSQGIVSAEETPTDISDEFSAQLLKTGPFKTDVAEARQMFGALRPDQTQKVLEVHPWAYNYLTPEQKTDQYKFSSSQSPLTWKAARDAAVATGGFFGNLLKSGANVGLDAAYATVAAPIKDAINRGTWTAYSDKDRPQTVEAYKKIDQDMRDASGAIAQGVIDAKRGIERIHGGPLAASDFTGPSVARATAGFGFSPLFLATQIAELAKNPNSGSLAFVDHINQHLGLETPEEAQRHWDIRKTYDAHKGSEDWTASGGEPKTSPWSKALYSPVGQELMTLRERSKLPDAETYASAKGISVDQARQELNNAADQNADQATRDITLRWNREYQPEMETLGAMFLGPAGMGEAGTVIGATGLLKKAATAAETLGMSDEAANAYFAAQKARQAKKLADEIDEAKKAGYAGKVAGSVENAQTRLAEAARAKFESLPPVVQKWGPVVLGKLGLAGVGGVAGEIVAPEDRTKGILGGVTLATGLGMAPGIVRSLSDASRVIGAGEGGVFEQAGKAGTSSKAAQVLFGGNRGKAADYIGNNLNTMLKSGVNMAALNAATSSFNSDDPKKFVESVGEGFGMGAAFPLLHKGAGVFHSIDPESEAVNRKKRDVEIYEAFNRADAPTQANLSKVTDYNNAIQRARKNQTAMQAHLEEAVKSGDQKKIDEATKAKNVADSLLKQVLRANVQTRNEYGRNFLSLYTDINSLANGARKAGQPRLQMQLRTKAEIMADLVKEAQASGQPINPADIEHQADQQGFYHRDGKFVVNLDRILARQSLFGESPTEALLHEGAGHGLFNIPEFRELNKKAENLLFDRYQKDLQGNIIDTKKGQYSDDELVDMYTNKYLGNEDDAGKLQFARASGLLDEKGDLDRNKVVQYMKEEIIAELNAGNLRQGLGKLKNASPVENWINNNLKSSRLARAVQAVTGLGIKPFSSDVVGAKFGTDVVEANRRALKALADYNGNFSDQTEEEKGSDIPEKEMRANPSTARRYGLNGGEFQTQLVGVLKDANGNVIQKVPIANPNAAEGTWAHDPENNQVKQTRGYGQVPDEFQGVSVPENGTLEVTRDFVYEPDGKTPVRTPDKKLAELEKSRGDLIRQALESADDRYGTVGLLPYSADGLSWKGIMSPKQIQAIKEIPESILPLSIKEKIFSFNEALARGEGDTFDLDYAARLGKGRKYKGRRSEIYHTIPVGFAFSKEGNFLLRTLSLGALFRKIKARQQRMPGYFDPWNGDVHLFSKELQDTYLKNTFNGKPGWLGLDPNNPTEETPLAKLKKDRFNDMMNLVNADTRSFNENRMVTPRDTSKRGSKAGDVDNLWRDHRLDAIADLVNTTEATGGYPMDRERIYKNFLPTEAPGTKPVGDTRKEENNPILKALGAITATHVPADQRTPYAQPVRAANEDVRRISENYVKNAGMEYRPHGQAVPVNEELAKRIADHYEEAKNDPSHPEVKKAYTALASEVVNQWKAFEKAGYTATPWTGKGQPYANSAEMMKDVRDNKHLYYFQTKEGYGESGITAKMRAENPMLQDSGVNFNGADNVPVNDVFRVVHDIVGHGANGYEFGPKGEFNAYLEHSRMFSDEAKPALAGETLAQNSWVNYGPHLRDEAGNIAKKGEKGYVPVTERPFAEQKNIALPKEFIDAAESQAGTKAQGPSFLPAKGESKPVPTQEELDQMKARLPKYRVTSGDSSEGSHGINLYDDKNKHVGMAEMALSEDGRFLTILNSEIWPVYRSKGYGEALYREIAKYAQQEGAEILLGSPVSESALKVRNKLFPTESAPRKEYGNAAESEISPFLNFLPAKETKVQHTSEEKEGSIGGTLDLVHFGAYGIKSADPKKLGKGSATGIDRAGLPKTYFYLNGTPYEDAIKSQTPYLAKVDGNSIYDLDKDPLGLQQTNREKMDKAIKDAGFAGYFSAAKDGQGFSAVAMFKPTKLTEAQPEDVFSKAEAKRLRAAGGPEIDYAAQDAAFEAQQAKGPSFLPAKNMPSDKDSGNTEEKYSTNEKGFYSGLQKTIHEKMPAKASPQQILSIVNNPQNAKPEEVKWSNLEGFLEGKKSVTKQEVLDYLKNEGAVKFEEVTLREDNSEVEAWWSDEGGANEETPFSELSSRERSEAIERYKEEVGDYKEEAPKYSQYVLPNGENYREVVLTMPNNFTPKKLSWDEIGMEKFGKPYSELTEEQFAEVEKESNKRKEENSIGYQKQDEYKSSHFTDIPNYVAHMRLDERKDAAGKEGLFIEEIQSDRHQQGREKGYAITESDRSRLDDLSKKKDEGTITDNESLEAKELAEKLVSGGIPDAPFRKDWSVQMFKRALRDAVDSGKEWIGWTSGETQAERYDLSKQVDRIEYHEDKQGGRLTGGKGDEMPIVETGVTPDKLPDYIGKEAAQKLLAKEKTENGWRVLENADLKVGGEGMKGFYDQILPKEIGKYVKKWGGKVEKGNTDATYYNIFDPKGKKIETQDTREAAEKSAKEHGEGYTVEPSKDGEVPFWKVEITPEMRDSIKQGGQIAFMPAKKGVDAGTETDESLTTDERQTANNARAQGAGQQAGGQSQEDRNRLLSGLASVARGSQSSGTEGVPGTSGTATRKEVEEAALRKHAEENGLMVDPEPFHKQWQLDGSEAGGEHQVSFPPGPDVVKRTPNPYYPTWGDYFDAVQVHNTLFPRAALTFRGFQDVENGGTDIDGTKWPSGLYSEVSQPFLKIKRGLTVPETDAMMQEIGFRRTLPMEYVNDDLGIKMKDLHGMNAVMLEDENGKEFPYVIDSTIVPTKAKEEQPRVMLDGHVVVTNPEADFVAKPKILVNFLPASQRINLEDYADKPMFALPADRMGVGTKYVGPTGDKKKLSVQAQGGPEHMTLLNHGVWAFSNEGPASTFANRVDKLAEKHGTDSVLVAVTLQSPINHLKNPTGQLGYVEAMEQARDTKNLTQKQLDAQIKEMSGAIVASKGKDMDENVRSKWKAINSFSKFADAVRAKKLNFGDMDPFLTQMQRSKLPISAKELGALGLLPHDIARDLSTDWIFDLPNDTVVGLFEVKKGTRPTQDNTHYSYPWSVAGKPIGFLKDIYHVKGLTTHSGIQKSTSLAWPLQRALPELDNLKKALSDLKPIVTYR